MSEGNNIHAERASLASFVPTTTFENTHCQLSDAVNRAYLDDPLVKELHVLSVALPPPSSRIIHVVSTCFNWDQLGCHSARDKRKRAKRSGEGRGSGLWVLASNSIDPLLNPRRFISSLSFSLRPSSFPFNFLSFSLFLCLHVCSSKSSSRLRSLSFAIATRLLLKRIFVNAATPRLPLHGLQSFLGCRATRNSHPSQGWWWREEISKIDGHAVDSECESERKGCHYFLGDVGTLTKG